MSSVGTPSASPLRTNENSRTEFGALWLAAEPSKVNFPLFPNFWSVGTRQKMRPANKTQLITQG